MSQSPTCSCFGGGLLAGPSCPWVASLLCRSPLLSSRYTSVSLSSESVRPLFSESYPIELLGVGDDFAQVLLEVAFEDTQLLLIAVADLEHALFEVFIERAELWLDFLYFTVIWFLNFRENRTEVGEDFA